MYEYCEPVSNACEKCGQSGSHQRLGLWADADDPVEEMDTAVCLNCAFGMLSTLRGSLSHLDEVLYEGDVISEMAGEDGAIVTVKTPFGIIQVEHDASIEHKEWSDPGGGVNGAGAPRRSKEWTELDAASTGTVTVIEPREQKTGVTTSYWARYFDDYDVQ